MTPEQVSQILQIHPFTVLKFIKQGKLKASKLGRVYRIRKSDVDKFLDEQAERASQKASATRPEGNLRKEREARGSGTDSSKKENSRKQQTSPQPTQTESSKETLPNFSPDSFITSESSEGLTKETPESHPPHHEDHYIINIKP